MEINQKQSAPQDVHESKDQTLSLNSGLTPECSFLHWVSIFGAVGAVVIALLGLSSYTSGFGLLGSIRADYIPMAPSTAFSFIVLGGAFLALVRRPLSGFSFVIFSLLTAGVTLFGALELLGSFLGMDLSFEEVLVPDLGYLGEIPIGRMSPATGGGMLLAGLGVLALLWKARRFARGTFLEHFSGTLGCGVLVVSFVFCLEYLQGTPLLYGQGAVVPMALTTALAFLMIGAAMVGASGENAMPLALLETVKRSVKDITVRGRFLSLVFIMVVACATLMVLVVFVLYRHELKENREMLQLSAQSQARLIEAVARHDANAARALQAVDPDYDAYSTTMKQVISAHEELTGFGETGAFIFARRDGDSIRFIFNEKSGMNDSSVPIGFDSDLAEPMHRALNGQSGTVIGLDYRGEMVLAAYEPVAGMNLGIVAKIDMSEVRLPFIRASIVAIPPSLIIILLGTVLFFWISNPMICQLEGQIDEFHQLVAERLKVEAELQDSEERFRFICENAPVLIDAFDANGHCVLWNKQCCETFGWTIDEINAHGDALALFYPDPPVYAEVLQAVTTDPSGTFREWYPRTKTGQTRSTLWANFRLPDGVVFGLGHDITERKQTEMELAKHRTHLEDLVLERTARLNVHVDDAEELNSAMVNVLEDLQASKVNLETKSRQLIASNKELDAFSYSVSHDLRAPLRHVDGFVQILRKREQGRLDATSTHYLDVISESASRMGCLIDDLLAFSRTGRTQVGLHQVDSNAVVRESQRELSPSTHSHSITWKIQDLPPVEADRGLLRQVWDNLIGNAIKYSSHCEKALIEIGTMPKQNEDGDDEITFFIRDNGVGFDAQYAHKLFGVFQRLHRADEFEGTGIGLAIVQRIIHRHGGRVWAEGKVGAGATFYFLLNAKKGEA